MPNNRVMGEALTLPLRALEATRLGKHGRGHPDHLQSREKVLFSCSLSLNGIRPTSSGVTQFQARCGRPWEGRLPSPLRCLHWELH